MVLGITRELIGARIAKELRDGMYVNLGMGLPGYVSNFIPEGMDSQALAYSNKFKEACQLLKSVSIEIPGEHWAQLALFLMNAFQGEKSKALEIVTEEFVIAMKGDPWFAIWTADSYAIMDLKEEELNLLCNRIARRC
jgi:hypothetical protein